MRVTGIIQSEKTVTLSDETVDKIVVQELCRTFGIMFIDLTLPHSSVYIGKDGYLYHEYEQSAGSHSHFQTETIREATEEDRLFFKMMEHLHSTENDYAGKYGIEDE